MQISTGFYGCFLRDNFTAVSQARNKFRYYRSRGIITADNNLCKPRAASFNSSAYYRVTVGDGEKAMVVHDLSTLHMAALRCQLTIQNVS